MELHIVPVDDRMSLSVMAALGYQEIGEASLPDRAQAKVFDSVEREGMPFHVPVVENDGVDPSLGPLMFEHELTPHCDQRAWFPGLPDEPAIYHRYGRHRSGYARVTCLAAGFDPVADNHGRFAAISITEGEIVLLETYLSEMSGPQVAARIRHLGARCPGTRFRIARVEAIEEGGEDKPAAERQDSECARP